MGYDEWFTAQTDLNGASDGGDRVQIFVVTVCRQRAADGRAAGWSRLAGQLDHMIAAALWTNINVC